MFSWYTEMVGKSVGLGQTDTRLMGFLHKLMVYDPTGWQLMKLDVNRGETQS